MSDIIEIGTEAEFVVQRVAKPTPQPTGCGGST